MKFIDHIPFLCLKDLKSFKPLNTVKSDIKRGKIIIGKGESIGLNTLPQSYINTFQDIYCEGIDYQTYYRNLEIQQRQEALEDDIEAHVNIKSTLVKHLLNAIETEFINYIKDFANQNIKKSKVIQLAKEKSLWIALDEIAKKNKIKTAYEAYRNLGISGKYNSKQNFYKRYKEVVKSGKVEILHAGVGNNNSKKLTDQHKFYIEKYASDPRKFPFSTIAEFVNIWASKEGLKTLCESTVRAYLKQPEIWNRVLLYRDPKKFKNTVAPFQKRDKAKFSCDQWQIDGTPLNFHCKDENGKIIRLNLFVVLDTHSNKIIGFDISKTEDYFNFYRALYNAVKLTNLLPFEIISDNASWTKRDEYKDVHFKLNSLGTTIRPHKVGNAKDKGNVESGLGSLNTQIFRFVNGFYGDGYLAHREGSRIAESHVQATHKNLGYQTIDEAKKLIIQCISQWNELDINGRTAPSKLFKECLKPNAIKVLPEQFSLLFWNERKVKVSRSILTIEISKTKFEYDPYDNETRLNMNGKTVKVRYDESDMRSVHVFDLETDNYIGEWKPCIRINQALANQTEDDKEKIIKGAAHNKAIETVIKKRAARLREKTIALNGKEIESIDPFSYRKELVNAKEDSEILALYELNGIDPVLVKDQPQYISKNEYNSDKKPKELNRLHSKKFEKQTEFPIAMAKDIEQED